VNCRTERPTHTYGNEYYVSELIRSSVAILDRSLNVSEYGMLRHSPSIILDVVRRLGVYQTQRLRNLTCFRIHITTQLYPSEGANLSLWTTNKFQRE
jgi:hypothetical protein